MKRAIYKMAKIEYYTITMTFYLYIVIKNLKTCTNNVCKCLSNNKC